VYVPRASVHNLAVSQPVAENSEQPKKRVLVGILALAAIGLFCGWQAFWFLTDDAYISFRYISNSQLGHGYVWNAPPFLPVEGYTSFLWVVLLDGVWSLFGIAPPDSANALALGFSFVTLSCVSVFVWRMPLPVAVRPLRPWLLVLVLAGTLCSRTFLAWTSSGLETAMFNAFIAAWLLAASRLDAPTISRWLAFCACAAGISLTRPDGLLFVGFTGLALLLASTRQPRSSWSQLLIGATPLLALPAHLLWRHATYGEWLPNTYYAKYTAPWPEAGARYLASFVLEYALWIWVGFALVAFAARWRRLLRPRLSTFHIALAALALHALYYTFVIGGDHFEYRVYSQLVPWIFVSFAWLAACVFESGGRVVTAQVLFVVLGLPIPWVHFANARALDTRKDTKALFVPIASHLPAFMGPYTRAFDSLQAWLIERSICRRYREHKVFLEYQERLYPPRPADTEPAPEGNPVFATGPVGLPAWSMPHVHIIDTLGLNDYVIARSAPTEERLMAHSRTPPEGYVESFQPNVKARGYAEPQYETRAISFSDADIVRIEAAARAELER